MIRFCRKSGEATILLFVKAEQTFGSSDIVQTTLFSPGSTGNEPNITKFCFPLDTFDPSDTKEERFLFYLKSSESFPTYGYVYLYCQNNKRIAYCMISPFYDPPRIFHIIQQSTTKPQYEISEYVRRNFQSQVKNDFMATEKCTIQNNITELCSIFDLADVGRLIVYMVLDFKIIIAGSDVGKVSRCGHALLSAIHPLQWPGVFIPMLPESMIDTVYAPFPYIIGLHKNLVPQTENELIETHVLMDCDTKTISFYPEEIKIPAKAMKAVESFKKKVVHCCFDKSQIQKLVHKLVLKAIGAGVGMKPNRPDKMYKNWEKLRNSPKTDGYSFMVSQSQVVLSLMREIENGPGSEIYGSYFNPDQLGTSSAQKDTYSGPQSQPNPPSPLVSGALDDGIQPFNNSLGNPSPLLSSFNSGNSLLSEKSGYSNNSNYRSPMSTNSAFEEITRMAALFSQREVDIDTMLKQQKEAEMASKPKNERPESMSFGNKLQMYNVQPHSNEPIRASESKPIMLRSRTPDPVKRLEKAKSSMFIKRIHFLSKH
ncbi:hypothetical protein TRFO_34898 [Tritrichomonas foetus]|uniref:UDENN domain-containing protein n=1 Tax=Tritrichomonas foetus TaxID=1144522 RepID=A0A1J4JJW2_9EUKA|nr:hypothetical protein TRFO_34898 [Tritrichomonas foetus]|eukprot:OHS98647.1 hypothetical protein TRFO_34898 [Tritrichomonas foetus]